MQYVSLPWAPPLYFLYYAAAATLLPFLTIYYQDLGLTGTQIGLLASMPPLLSLVSAPVWGVVSDTMKQRKLSLLIAIGGAILLALALSAVRGFVWLIPTVMLFSFFFSPDHAACRYHNDQHAWRSERTIRAASFVGRSRMGGGSTGCRLADRDGQRGVVLLGVRSFNGAGFPDCSRCP